MDKVIETLEELTQITSIMPETRFQMALTMAITDLNRARQLEAECATLRQVLEDAPDLYECAWAEGNYAARGIKENENRYASQAKEILANMQQALAPDAGKALLEKVQRLEAVAEAAKAIGDELGDCQCGNAWCTKARVLKQALAALEGGAGDAK